MTVSHRGIFSTDHYDLAVAVSAFIPGHIEAKAVREMVNMVREGTCCPWT